MVNLKRTIDLTKEIQKNQKNENGIEKNNTLNYEIKNKSKIHKRTINKLKIKKIRTRVKTFINQMITLNFCMNNMNFEGRKEKNMGQKALPTTNHVVKKKKDFYA